MIVVALVLERTVLIVNVCFLPASVLKVVLFSFLTGLSSERSC